jgi:hypothetical protein
VTSHRSTLAAGNTSGRPARAERGEHLAESVLSLDAGAGPTDTEGYSMATQPCPARPVRYADPARNAAYWERVKRNAASAPPLTDDQIATLRGIFLSAAREAA